MVIASVVPVGRTNWRFKQLVCVCLWLAVHGQAQKAVIRDVVVSPSLCRVGTNGFDPTQDFHIVECPTQVRNVSISFKSPYHVSWADGRELVMPLKVSLDVGEAKPLSVQACSGSSSDRKSCTSYLFDVFIRGSSEAFLDKLMLSVRKGEGIAELSPVFAAEVTHYVANVPFASSIEVTAAAAKAGFVSFESFQDAERHHVLSKTFDMDASATTAQTVFVYVTSSDMQGRIKYKVSFQQLPNADAGLTDIRYSTGILQPSFDTEIRQYSLKVPTGTPTVAISADARDERNARVTVYDRTGIGYSSSIVDLQDNPEKVVHVNVVAADRVHSTTYVIIVLTADSGDIAVLQSLVVANCLGGLQPRFHLLVHHYRCQLDAFQHHVRVTPNALWIPGEHEHETLRIGDQSWKTGGEWLEPLDDYSGKATVRIVVTSPSKKKQESYTISATGFPKDQRSIATTTTTTTMVTTTALTTIVTTTTMLWIPIETVAPVQTHTTITRTTSITTTTLAGRPWFSFPKLHFPKLPNFKFPHIEPPHIQLPQIGRFPDPMTLVPPFWIISSAILSFSLLSLVFCDGLANCIAMLKQLQFVALSGTLAPPMSWIQRLTRQYNLVNLWIALPHLHIRNDDLDARRLDGKIVMRLERSDFSDQDDLLTTWVSDAQMRLGNLCVFIAMLPPLLIMLLCGIRVAFREDKIPMDRRLRDVGFRGLQLKLLPFVLCVLDCGLIGFTDSVCALIFRPIDVTVEAPMRLASFTLPSWVLCLLMLSYPIAFCFLGLAQLHALEHVGRLAYSQVLKLYADAQSVAVTLRGPSFTAWSPTGHELRFTGGVCSSEFRSIVPVRGVEGGPLQLARKISKDHDVDTESNAESEVEIGLLSSKPQPLSEWRMRQETIGMLLWMERRCAAYELLKVQIQEAERNGLITDARGMPIFDKSGELLSDLYQYCIYQFPLRPWRKQPLEGPSDNFEPKEIEGGGVRAYWVPAARDIRNQERALVDAWLNRWLIEAETATRTREELQLLQVRGYDPMAVQEEQIGLLREMGLALLEERPARKPRDFSSEEAEERESTLREQVEDVRRRGTGPPWSFEIDASTAQEAVAVINTEFLNADMDEGRLDQILSHHSLKKSAFGLKRLHVRMIGEDPYSSVIGRSLEGLVESASVVGTRTSLAACPLYLSDLTLFAKWMPPFSFLVPYKALRLPLRRNWLPLFPSASGHGPPGTLTLDAFERIIAVVAIVSARFSVRHSCEIFASWWIVAGLLRHSRGHESWQTIRSVAPQIMLCIICFFLEFGRHLPHRWMFPTLDALSVLVVATSMAKTGQQSLRRFTSVLLRGQARNSLRPAPKYDVDAPSLANGIFTLVGSVAEGRPLKTAFVVPFLGLFIKAEPCYNSHACTDEQRLGACQKRLAIYEAPPARGSLVVERRFMQLRELTTFHEIRDIMPVVISRAQLAGSEELHDLVCTIHVVNHAGKDWSSLPNDSYLSLYKPLGLDSSPASNKENPYCMGAESRRGFRGSSLTPQNKDLLKFWQAEVMDWLFGEVGASSNVEYTAFDTMMFSGGEGRDDVQVESDRRVVPGLFSFDCLGSTSFAQSRCFHDGLVLHYVILSSELKPSFTWRPDPLPARLCYLKVNDDGDWRQCLLRHSARGIRYVLRKQDENLHGGSFPNWDETQWYDHGDVAEYSLPFVYVGRVVVEDTSDQGARLKFFSRHYSPLGGQPQADYLNKVSEREAEATSRGPRQDPSEPLVFYVDAEMAVIWQSIVQQCGMSRREENIVHYSGPLCEHPHIQHCMYRHGADGEQLWENGTVYRGSWEGHLYHGYGQLSRGFNISGGEAIYKGQWLQGMRHGRGIFYFRQGAIKHEYDGEWERDEFKGFGELRVAAESQDELSQRPLLRRSHTIVRYRGYFAVASGQFLRYPNLVAVDPENQVHLVEKYFPRLQTGVDTYSQHSGVPPTDFAMHYYSLDGNDIRHCGPDERTGEDGTDTCEIDYADGTRYRGPCAAAGIPHAANAVLIEANGTKYEGAFKNGLRTGEGRITLTNGITYEGQFLEPGGVVHGHGSLTLPSDSGPELVNEMGFSSYEGQHQHGFRCGEGAMQLLDHEVYEGEFRDNLRHGQGTWMAMDGLKYTGPWENDRLGTGEVDVKYGSGRDGYQYLGDMANGLRHGEGNLMTTHFMGARTIYSGEWKDDLMHGKGTLSSEDGEYYGEFRSGMKNGRGRFTWSEPSGKEYDGEWFNDQPHGIGTLKEVDSFIHENAVVEIGRLTSTRLQAPSKSFKDRMFKKRTGPQHIDVCVKATPKDFPKGRNLQRSNELLSREPAALKDLNEGSGVAHGRRRPAHMGIEGVPGTRWA